MNRFFFSAVAGICLLILSFLFFNDSGVSLPTNISLDISSVKEISFSLNAELDMLLDTVDRVVKAEDDIKPYFDATLRRLGLSIHRKVEQFSEECPDNIGDRLKQFSLKIREGTATLVSRDPQEEKTFNVSSFKRDIWTLKNLVLLGTKKIKEEEIIHNKVLSKSSAARLNAVVSVLFGISFLLLLNLILLQLKLVQIGKIIGSGKDSSPKAVADRIEEIKADTREDVEETRKKLFREQIGSRRKSVLLDTIPAGIVSVGSNNEITYVNEKIRLWFGFNDDIVGQSVEMLYSRLGIESFEEGKLVVEGDFLWVTVHEELNEKFIVLRNITEQENMARKLLDSERLVSIGEMASRITHEIRNPLSTIKLNSEYMVENISDMDEKQIVSSMELIVKEVKRLETITDKYMNLVKYRSFHEAENEVSLPLELVQFISFHAPEFDKRKINLSLKDIPECDLSITVSSFKEIVLNLLKNSWEELEMEGNVEISVGIRSGKALIKVEDSGKGIPDSEKEIVFKNFYTKKPGGTGIGLSHSRKLAEEAGGSLTVLDSGLGGACFLLELPVRIKR